MPTPLRTSLGPGRADPLLRRLSRRSGAARWVLGLVVSAALLPTAGRAQGASAGTGLESGGLQQCRQLVDAAVRLACYDALPLPGLAPSRASPQGPAAASVPAAQAVPPSDRREASFGLPAKAPAEAEAVQSSLAREMDGWGANTVFVLAIGQRWQVVDGSQGVLLPENRRVTVRRASLGSYVMEFEGLNRSPRVKRLQ